MGLSRNKVAVSEGAAGSPPFYGDRDRMSRFCHTSQDEVGTQKAGYRSFVVQFSGTGTILEKKRNPWYGGVAQLGEHLPCKQGVMGSNPIISTNRTVSGAITRGSSEETPKFIPDGEKSLNSKRKRDKHG